MIPSTKSMIRQHVILSQMILLSSVFRDCLILKCISNKLPFELRLHLFVLVVQAIQLIDLIVQSQ